MTLLLLAAQGARAQPAASLSVERADSASDCPDQTALAASVSLLLRRRGLEPAADPSAARFHVSLHRSETGYHATIEVRGEQAGLRTLDDAGSTCAGLADAVAVTLALLLDPDFAVPSATRAEPRSAAPPPRSRGPTAQRPAPAPARRAAPVRLSIEAAPVLALSVTRGVSAGATAGVRAWHADGPVLALGGLLLPPGAEAFGPGEVELGLMAGTLSPCWRVLGEQEGPRLAGCAMSALGVLQARGRGYQPDREPARAWYAAGAGAVASGPLPGPIEWGVQSTVLAPLRRQSYVVDGLGTAHESAGAGLVVAAGLALAVP
jgi:hypothetical protein